MLISFSTLALASQLIVTVADNVPSYNIERKCSAFNPGEVEGVKAFIKRCTDDEQVAKDQLQRQWAQFAPSEKATCMGLTTDDSLNPSYRELLTCLQAQPIVQKPKD